MLQSFDIVSLFLPEIRHRQNRESAWLYLVCWHPDFNDFSETVFSSFLLVCGYLWLVLDGRTVLDRRRQQNVGSRTSAAVFG